MRQTFRIIRYLKRSACLRRKADEIIKEAQEQARAWRNEMLPSDNRQLIQRLRQQFTIMRGLDGLFFLQGSGGGALFNLLELIEKYCPGEGHALAAALLAESDPSTTAMQGYELMTLAGIAANDPAALAWLRNCNRIGSEWNQHLPECSPFRTAFADFLERYGHRAIAESYFRNTRWREQPDYLLDAVLGLMGSEINSVRARQQRVAQNAWQQIRQCIPIWVRPLLRHWIKAAGVESNHREAARSALIAYLEAIRLSVLELGKRLTGPSGLDRVEDIFNLTAQEILALGEGRLPAHYAARRATARHQIMTAWMAEQEPDVIVESDSCVDTLTIPDTQHNISTGDGWLGTPVGAGYAKSRVCIATTPSAGHAMNQGDILAAPSTDPAWTPLFLKASGLVMETGGYLSHGAIVAREFGIPAVVNIPGVLKQLEAGEVIEVDGNRGRVRRVRD